MLWGRQVRWLATSAKGLHHLQILQLLESTSSQLVIPSKSLEGHNNLLKVFPPFYDGSQEKSGKPSAKQQSNGRSQSFSVDHFTLLSLNARL